MRVGGLTRGLIGPVRELMAAGAPFVRARGESEYWLYAEHFSDTCPVVIADDGTLLAAAIAFQSQTRPKEIYIQDIMVAPGNRGQGYARTLIGKLQIVAAIRDCTRLTLTSEAENRDAHATWLRLGFTNCAGDWITADGISVIADYKGEGKHRAVYTLDFDH